MSNINIKDLLEKHKGEEVYISLETKEQYKQLREILTALGLYNQYPIEEELEEFESNLDNVMSIDLENYKSNDEFCLHDDDCPCGEVYQFDDLDLTLDTPKTNFYTLLNTVPQYINILIRDFEQYLEIRKLLIAKDYKTQYIVEREREAFDCGWNRLQIMTDSKDFLLLSDYETVRNRVGTYITYDELAFSETLEEAVELAEWVYRSNLERGEEVVEAPRSVSANFNCKMPSGRTYIKINSWSEYLELSSKLLSSGYKTNYSVQGEYTDYNDYSDLGEIIAVYTYDNYFHLTTIHNNCSAPILNYSDLELKEEESPKTQDLHDVIEEFKREVGLLNPAKEMGRDVGSFMKDEEENEDEEDDDGDGFGLTFDDFKDMGYVLCTEDTKDYKDTTGKLPLQLVDPIALSTLGKVIQYGIEKYGEENKCSYQNGEISTYIGAMLRHLVKYQEGELVDPESNMEHLEHMFFNAYAIIYLNSKKEGN